jgi:hypothetical protein
MLEEIRTATRPAKAVRSSASEPEPSAEALLGELAAEGAEEG